MIILEDCKKFLDQTFMGHVILLDWKCSITDSILRKAGISPNDVLIIDVESAEDVQETSTDILDKLDRSNTDGKNPDMIFIQP